MGIFTNKRWILLLPLLLCYWANAQVADFTYSAADTVYCTPYQMSFTQNCTGTPVGFVWDFGNGQKSNSAAESVTFITAGSYTVTLTAIYAAGAVSATKIIVVKPSPVVTINANKNNLCKPDIVSFTATGSPFITKYQWNFGDQLTDNSNSNSVSHPYRDYGNYTARLNVFTASGCKASADYSININKFDITAAMSADTGCIPASTTLTASINLPPGDAPLSYTWNFADGTAAATTPDSSITHVYNITDSIRNASVTINTAQGCSNTMQLNPFAFGTPPGNTSVRTVLMTDSFCGSEKIKFVCTASNANYYVWDFGDSSLVTVSDTLVTHQFSTLGNKKIIVTPFLNGCEGTKDSINILIKGVIAKYTYTNACDNKRSYQFTNGSLGNISHFNWAFSDTPGIKDSLNSNSFHNFPAYGTFNALLSIADNVTGCTDSINYNIYTAAPVFSSTTNSVCKDSLISYKVSATYPDSAGYNYEFHINGDSVLNGKDSVLNYYPTQHGNFNDYVVLKDANPGTCDDTLQLNNIIVKGPVVDFSSPPRTCIDKTFSFTNNSKPYQSTDVISNWRWDFDDSTYDAAKNPIPHIYARAALYTVRLTATDINGCAQTKQREVRADRLPQVMVFPSTDTICQGRDTAMLTGYTIDSLSWVPTTSISCIDCDTTRVYPFNTTMYIAKATTRFGCISYDTSIVKVFAPFTIKVFPEDTSICPGKPISYKLNMPGITTWTPALSLGNRSNNFITNPIQDVTYTVIVQDSAGCFADTATANVHVYPLPQVNAGPDQTLPYNNSFTITPAYGNDVVSYNWEPANKLSCSNCASPSGIALQTTTYTVKTTSVNGCQSSDNISIFIACENGNLLLPTAFSPNGNGINEYFYPIARGYKTIKKFVIFNRRGNKVFERQNFAPNTPSQGWDGRINNSDYVADSETFAWFIEAECEQGQLVTNKGTVVLIR